MTTATTTFTILMIIRHYLTRKQRQYEGRCRQTPYMQLVLATCGLVGQGSPNFGGILLNIFFYLCIARFVSKVVRAKSHGRRKTTRKRVVWGLHVIGSPQILDAHI